MVTPRAAAVRRLGCRILAGFVAMVALVGCGVPAGDGKIGDDWKPMADAKVPVPPVGACYDTPGAVSARTVFMAQVLKMECTGPHLLETYHVGVYPADVAARQSVPPAGGPEQLAAFADCEVKAKEFLGDEWYTGRLHLIFTPTTARQWEGGGRHYRCDLAEVKTIPGMDMVSRDGSVRDGLRAARPLASTCFDFLGETEEAYEDLAPIDCGGPHDAEYAGIFVMGGELPADTAKRDEQAYAGCDAVVARYLGGTVDGMRVGTAMWGFEPEDRERGDKRVRCYASKPENKKLIGSVKGIGNGRPRTT